MTQRDGYPPCDEPHDWVIYVQGKTTDQMRDMGKVLGANGFTGTFHDGPIAYHFAEYKRLKDDYKKLLELVKGGDVNGNETVHEA